MNANRETLKGATHSTTARRAWEKTSGHGGSRFPRGCYRDRVSHPKRPTREEIFAATTPIVSQARSVRFQEVDAAGTIYFPRVLEYFADAYLEVLSRSGLDLAAILRERVWAAPLAHAEADFVRPLFFGDRVRVEVALAIVGNSSATFGYRIRGADDAIRSFGSTVHVFVDGKTFKPIDVPAALRAFLAKVES